MGPAKQSLQFPGRLDLIGKKQKIFGRIKGRGLEPVLQGQNYTTAGPGNTKKTEKGRRNSSLEEFFDISSLYKHLFSSFYIIFSLRYVFLYLYL
jgi:hypothetical protein